LGVILNFKGALTAFSAEKRGGVPFFLTGVENTAYVHNSLKELMDGTQ
jgi:hypothetical protein